MTPTITPQQAASLLRVGQIIAYPTEAVYGLGCDPFNERSVKHLLQLKQRDINKGLILIAALWRDVEFLVDHAEVSRGCLRRVFARWPGPVTWIFPASDSVPSWIRGEHNSIALRITAHPTAKGICKAFGGPIVSTSANLAGFPPARTRQEFLAQFDNVAIVSGRVGRLQQPTSIYDVLTGKAVRF